MNICRGTDLKENAEIFFWIILVKGNAEIFNLSGLNIAEKTDVKSFARVVTERHTVSV